MITARRNIELLKSFKQTYSTVKECQKEIEVEVLPKLKHPNIVSLAKIIYQNDMLYLVMELAKTDLARYFTQLRNDGRKFTEEQIKKMMRQIINGVAFMHQKGYMHRDLKPENILLADNNTLKIADLGTAKKCSDKFPFTNYVSTRWYRAPECVINTTNYSPSVDVFALGCIMAEMYTLKPVFCGKSSLDQLKKYCKILGTTKFENWVEGAARAKKIGFNFEEYHPECLSDAAPAASPVALDLLKSLLQFDPLKRINMEDILNHEFFMSKKPKELAERKIPLKNIFKRNEIKPLENGQTSQDLPPLDVPKLTLNSNLKYNRESMKNFIRNKLAGKRSLNSLAMVDETDNENSRNEETMNKEYPGFRLKKDSAKKPLKQKNSQLSKFKSGAKIQQLASLQNRILSSNNFGRMSQPELGRSESSNKGFKLRRSDNSALNLFSNSSLAINRKNKTYPIKNRMQSSENKTNNYEQSVMEEIEILQKNLEKAQRKQETLQVRRLNFGNHPEEGETYRDLYSRDNSPQRSLSPTEEYWTNFNQINSSLKSREILSSKKDRLAKIEISRSSNRRSAANEILFGNSGKNQSIGGSNQSSPAIIPQLNTLSNKSESLRLNGGFASYINRQEKLAKLQIDHNEFLRNKER
ncbi:unnamed protein product [Moneuplotes crassus]|uniref:Protein kinase domain-containing protein n=1 Tax=Euplotes crassus TaxID=5936 RepID=A0AAD1X4T3_EUPCR|nr:unnamed protein product [Moneuplotes crassus]